MTNSSIAVIPVDSTANVLVSWVMPPTATLIALLVGGAHIVDTAGFQIAADAAGLDVHNGARAQLDGGRRRPSRGDRLVEAHRRLDELRQLGVPEHVVLVEGLLDQEQVKGVEARQVSGVVERVGGVGVNLKQQLVAVALAHGPY